MGALIEDIKQHSEWLVKAFKADKFKLDYTLESFKAIDIFFDKHAINGKPVENGRLAQNTGTVIFSIGAYVGETLFRNIPGTQWVLDETDPQAEINVSLKLPDEAITWPVHRAIKRFRNGSEDGIYIYGVSIMEATNTNPPAPERQRHWWQLGK